MGWNSSSSSSSSRLAQQSFAAAQPAARRAAAALRWHIGRHLCRPALTTSARGVLRRAGIVLAVSLPERQTVTERTPPPPPPEVEVKVVGFGGRGAHALSKLVGHSQLAKAELWCLESDRAMLEGCPTSNTLLLPKDDASSSSPEGGMLSPADLASIVGRAASDAGGRGNMNAGTDGAITFVLAPAAAAPGGAATVLQVVGALRAAGHFTVAAVTQPFGFEGSGKREQAEELVAALKQAAHVVAVMEQDVLMQAFGSAQMTVAEATDIADTALEHTVLSILRAVQAEEVLKSSRGALMWHGRDLRHFKRILPPPVQQLLTRPGTAVLGRGLASMPAEAAHQMGAAQALMHLASDAVRAAAESPFLEGALLAASGVLVCIDLPPTAQQLYTGTGSAPQALAGLETPEGERRVLQLSAQAAAGALGTLSGPSCQDYVLTAQPRAAPLGSDGSLLQVEATLLVMRCSDSEQGGAPGGAAGLITRQMLLQQSGQQRYGVGPAVPPPPRQVRPPQRLPSSSWSMLSAVAGGKAAPPRPQQAGAKSTGQQQPAPQQVPAPQQQQPPQQQQSSRRVPSNLPNFFGGGASQQAQPGAKVGAKQQPGLSPANEQLQQQASASRQEPQRLPVQQQAALGAPTQPPADLEQPAEQQRVVPTPPSVADAAVGQAGREAAVDVELQPKATVGEYLVKASLKAQSLDLSPAAAQWRQEHRGDEFEQRKLIVWEVDDEPEPWQAEEEEESLGLAALLPPGMRKEKKKVDIRARLANVLSQDREDAAWADGNVDSDA